MEPGGSPFLAAFFATAKSRVARVVNQYLRVAFVIAFGVMCVGGYFAYRNARHFLAVGYRFGKRLTIVRITGTILNIQNKILINNRISGVNNSISGANNSVSGANNAVSGFPICVIGFNICVGGAGFGNRIGDRTGSTQHDVRAG
ncbi:MAG: hypothetical protein LBJ67_01205 [Planctomycetaceae bacterium]|nr:hypothetical protein [Planctomycetaceae bacterium]